MSTAQVKFKELIKNTIAPALRENGLKGSGQEFSIKSDDYWALIGLQKSMYSDSQGLKFTINIYVVSKQQWEEGREQYSYFPKKPSPNTKWQLGWSERIGMLMPSKLDHWWEFNNRTEERELAQQVVHAIMEYAVPAMQSRMKNA
ncbi:DUF4304 domain-containing protein [Teredinibacter turnerae]|uniref:DUF4304 domain-containing protein n=1 Tax=Teredinibacter turnerae TaxID=2426 RepID=UPI0003729A70|nr:DUF4304 domain-containing protein [Teredinibacter turnerae]